MPVNGLGNGGGYDTPYMHPPTPHSHSAKKQQQTNKFKVGRQGDGAASLQGDPGRVQHFDRHSPVGGHERDAVLARREMAAREQRRHCRR